MDLEQDREADIGFGADSLPHAHRRNADVGKVSLTIRSRSVPTDSRATIQL